jgi:hypothetical protein
MEFLIILALSDILKVILILGAAAIIVAGPLVVRILSGEKFRWFGDSDVKRPNREQWEQLRNKADRIIEGKTEIEGKHLYELVREMKIEVEGHKRNKGTIEYEKDTERIIKLSQKLQGMYIRIEPFDSLVERLKEDGLTGQAEKLHDMIHNCSKKSGSEIKKTFLAELLQIRDQHWVDLRQDTRLLLKQSLRTIKHNPFMSIYVGVALIVVGLALRFYHSIVKEKGYEFYIKHPLWIVVFILLIGVPAMILLIKIFTWKRSICENPYQ